MTTTSSHQTFVDPYQSHDFSNDSREDLLDIVKDLRERLAISEKNMRAARTDRDRYATLVGKTNDALLELKVGVFFCCSERLITALTSLMLCRKKSTSTSIA